MKIRAFACSSPSAFSYWFAPASSIDFPALARALGYAGAHRAKSREELAAALAGMEGETGPCFLEVRCAIGSRADLGRPTLPPKANKLELMRFLRS